MFRVELKQKEWQEGGKEVFLRAERPMPDCARCTLALARPVLGLSGGPAQVAAGCRSRLGGSREGVGGNY